MNVILPEKEKMKKRTIIVYIVSTFICILAVVIVIGIQILGDDIINDLFGLNKIVKRTEQEEALLKSNFENLFDNQLEDSGNYKTQKIEENKEIVYTNYIKEDKNANYELDINLPYINIKNKIVQEFNQEILNTYKAKAEEILESNEKNIIYTVKYKSYIENNILSLVIYSDLKQGSTPQRVIIETFNFNLEENKELKLEDVLKIYNLNKDETQNTIDEDISEEQKKAQDLKDLGYDVFLRDIESQMYKVENITEFFIYKNNIYIIFAYGNNSMTSEKDVVII